MGQSYYPNEDGDLNIARGLVKGTSIRNIFGTTNSNAFIVTDEFRTPWEEASNYAFPPDATIMELSSNNINDTAVSVLVSGLDVNYDPISEVKTLTGTTPVNTDNEYYRINDLVITAGNAIGEVTAASNSVNYAVISPGTGRDQKAVYTVPNGHEFYLTRINVFCTDSNGGKAARFRNFLISENGRELRVADTAFFSEIEIQRQAPFKYDEKTDIQMQLQSLGQSVFGSIFAEGILIKKGLG